MAAMKTQRDPGLFGSLAPRSLADRLRSSALDEVAGQDPQGGAPIRLADASGAYFEYLDRLDEGSEIRQGLR